jgi:hypothetical protein
MRIFKGLSSHRPDVGNADSSAARDRQEPVENRKLSDKLGRSADRQDRGTPAEGQDLVRDTNVRSMWDLVSDQADQGQPREPGPAAVPELDLPQRRSGRVKTRLLGVDHSNGTLEALGSNQAPGAGPVLYPVGWLVIVEGPGCGHAFPLRPGVSQIGRGDDQPIQLDFGDLSISREGHALIAYDEESRKFYIGFGGKANLVRLNGKPVLSTESLNHGDVIRIGETALMLAALCGPDFAWESAEG